MRFILAVACIAVLAASADAQVSTLVGAGFVYAAPDRYPGMHIVAGLDAAPTRTLHPRVDVVVAQSGDRDFFALANLVYQPSRRSLAPYFLGGAGGYLEHGTQLMGTLGAGVNVDKAWRVPLLIESIETRLVTGRDTHLILTFAVRP
jgi:hypothetical protein